MALQPNLDAPSGLLPHVLGTDGSSLNYQRIANKAWLANDPSADKISGGGDILNPGWHSGKLAAAQKNPMEMGHVYTPKPPKLQRGGSVSGGTGGGPGGGAGSGNALLANLMGRGGAAPGRRGSDAHAPAAAPDAGEGGEGAAQLSRRVDAEELLLVWINHWGKWPENDHDL